MAIMPLSVSAMLHIRSSTLVSAKKLEEDDAAPMNTTTMNTILNAYRTNLLFWVK